MCHCTACQKRTGSVFGVQTRWAPTQVTFEGAAVEWIRTGDSGGKITFRFCGTCGSSVYYTIDTMPDLIAVPIGAFADTSFPPPAYSVYEDRRHPWVVVPASAEHLG